MTSTTTSRKKLPIGIQSFAKLREGGFYYVDKTALALSLAQEAGYYFLSRPRRFGKSLFLDTLKELFEGNEALFNGLAVHPHWNWQQRHPVIRFSFGSGVLASRGALDLAINKQLEDHERKFALPARYAENSSRFADLIARLHAQSGQGVVVLIDEYDKPILDNITDTAVASALRDGLKDFYSVIKDMDPHIRFVLLTGVSRFSKVNLFSGLNNLNDITLDARYSSLCGYTDIDVDTVFAPELPGLDRQQIKRWYNGYNWRGQAVYNPFDLLLLFDKREFHPFWFESGSPTFLIKLMAQKGFFTPRLANLRTGGELISNLDVDLVAPEALLFQAGYLTIAHSEQTASGRWRYTLGYPNQEVAMSLNASLLSVYTFDAASSEQNSIRLEDLLANHDVPGLRALFQAFFASIPHHWYTNNPIAQYEGFYASVFYSYFAALGFDVRVEDATNHGRIDMTVKLPERIYLFEFKVVELVPDGRALQQLKDKAYAEKYKSEGLPIVLIGVEFSRESRNVVGFESEILRTTIDE
ncbi:MAG: hypothetical protein RL748_603 [Pseudomonadota bacterium]